MLLHDLLLTYFPLFSNQHKVQDLDYKRTCYHHSIQEVRAIAAGGLMPSLSKWLHKALEGLRCFIDIYFGRHDIRLHF